MSQHDGLLAETIARHFAKATASGTDVALGFAGVHLNCRVDGVREVGNLHSASLFFLLRGGALGDVPIFASMSGYGGSVEEAVIAGACNWASIFGPVLETALTGASPPPDSDPTVFETTIDGRRYRVVLDGLDRAMITGNAGDVSTLTADARRHLGGTPWLTPGLLSSGLLPVLPLERVSVVSLFCCESSGERTLEIKVNGVDWSDGTRLVDAVPHWDGASVLLLRELAVLVPLDGGPQLTRERIECTLRGAERQLGDGERRPLVAWPGWSHHSGQLGKPATESDLTALESAVGPLPEDYRAFLSSVQASGAGPGYGLLSPFNARQVALAAGEFDFVDGARPDTEPKGAIALAHAGCGVMWLLVLRGPSRGEVWVDPVGSDQIARRVAPSFVAWYAAWLESIVRNEERFTQWDAARCATASAFSQFLEKQNEEGKSDEQALEALGGTEPGAVSLVSGGGTYFCRGDALAPCQACTTLARRLGLSMEVFGPGSEPYQGRPGRLSLVSRVLGRRW